MHELSLTQSLIDIVEDYARREGFSRVNVLKLSFGRLACIDPGTLEFVFDIRPAVLYCTTCKQESLSGSFQPFCPRCDSGDVLLTGGTEELKLLEMDVD